VTNKKKQKSRRSLETRQEKRALFDRQPKSQKREVWENQTDKKNVLSSTAGQKVKKEKCGKTTPTRKTYSLRPPAKKVKNELGICVHLSCITVSS